MEFPQVCPEIGINV
jgi:hypothetical protein